MGLGSNIVTFTKHFPTGGVFSLLLSFLAEKLQIYFRKDLSPTPLTMHFFNSLFKVHAWGSELGIKSLSLTGIRFHNMLCQVFSLENNPLLWSRALMVFHNSCFFLFFWRIKRGWFLGFHSENSKFEGVGSGGSGWF